MNIRGYIPAFYDNSWKVNLAFSGITASTFSFAIAFFANGRLPEGAGVLTIGASLLSVINLATLQSASDDLASAAQKTNDALTILKDAQEHTNSAEKTCDVITTGLQELKQELARQIDKSSRKT